MWIFCSQTKQLRARIHSAYQVKFKSKYYHPFLPLQRHDRGGVYFLFTTFVLE